MAPPVVPAVPVVRSAEPDAATAAAARAKVRQALADEFAKARVPDSQARLARDLRTTMDVVPDDRVELYATLVEVHELAVKSGSVVLAMRTVADLDKWFTIDAFSWKRNSIKGLIGEVHEPVQRAKLVEEMIALGEAALEQKKLDDAQQLLTDAQRQLPKISDVAVRKTLLEKVNAFKKSIEVAVLAN